MLKTGIDWPTRSDCGLVLMGWSGVDVIKIGMCLFRWMGLLNMCVAVHLAEPISVSFECLPGRAGFVVLKSAMRSVYELIGTDRTSYSSSTHFITLAWAEDIDMYHERHVVEVECKLPLLMASSDDNRADSAPPNNEAWSRSS